MKEHEQAEVIRLRVQSLMVKVLDAVDAVDPAYIMCQGLRDLAAAYESLVTAAAMKNIEEDTP